jgi:hypothetical protein
MRKVSQQVYPVEYTRSPGCHRFRLPAENIPVPAVLSTAITPAFPGISAPAEPADHAPVPSPTPSLSSSTSPVSSTRKNLSA